MNYGPYNRNMNVLNIQPVLPFAGEPERDDVNHMLLNLQTQLYYNVVRPDFGPEWQWRFQAQILLPNSIFKRK